MKKFLLGSVGLAALLAGPAMAADMRLPPPPPPAPVYYDWTGAYIGFNAGGVWYDMTRHFPTPGGPSPDFRTSDLVGISHGGFVSLAGARQFARQEGLSAWDIFHGNDRIEYHDPDDRERSEVKASKTTHPRTTPQLKLMSSGTR